MDFFLPCSIPAWIYFLWKKERLFRSKNIALEIGSFAVRAKEIILTVQSLILGGGGISLLHGDGALCLMQHFVYVCSGGDGCVSHLPPLWGSLYLLGPAQPNPLKLELQMNIPTQGLSLSPCNCQPLPSLQYSSDSPCTVVWDQNICHHLPQTVLSSLPSWMWIHPFWH